MIADKMYKKTYTLNIKVEQNNSDTQIISLTVFPYIIMSISYNIPVPLSMLNVQ